MAAIADDRSAASVRAAMTPTPASMITPARPVVGSRDGSATPRRGNVVLAFAVTLTVSLGIGTLALMLRKPTTVGQPSIANPNASDDPARTEPATSIEPIPAATPTLTKAPPTGEPAPIDSQTPRIAQSARPNATTGKSAKEEAPAPAVPIFDTPPKPATTGEKPVVKKATKPKGSELPGSGL